MYLCINNMYLSLYIIIYNIYLFYSPAPVVGFGLELAVDYLYSEPERAVSP